MDLRHTRQGLRRWAVAVGVLMAIMGGGPAVAAEVSYAFGYTRANNPTASSYTPTAAYSYNSSGSTITITRSSTGSYAVRFRGLGGNGTAGGHVQVTAYGSGSEACKVSSWSSSGPDFIVYVRCFTAAGIPVNTQYNVLVTWPVWEGSP